MTTYSSIATNMWPPPSSDTASRLQRLQELENMRKQRQIQSGMTSASEPSDSGTRLSRRQQISGSIGLHRLTASHEEKRKSFQGRRALAEGRTSSLSGSYRSLPNNNEHGGARPKNFEVLSLRRNVSSHEDGINRERSTSLTSSSEDIATPLLRSKSVTGIPVSQPEKLGQPAMEVEKGTYSVAQTSDSQRNTSISEDEEDIESFKRSLFGKQSLVHVPEKEELMLTQGLSVFTDPITTANREIDTSKLVIHREEPKVEKQYSKSFSDFSGQQRLNNIVGESMTRLDKLFDQPTSKFESVTQNPRITRSDRFEQQHIVSREPHDRNFSREKLVLNVHSRSKGQTELIKGTDAKSSGATSHTVSENQVDLPKQSESTVYPISNEQIDVKEVTQIVSENAAENIILENQSSAFINKANLTKSQFELPLDNQNSLVEGTKQSVEIQSSVKGIDSSTEYVSKGEQNDQEHIQTDSVTESSNLLSYPTHMKKEDEEDLVDASNVAFFEMDSNDSNQYIQNIAGDSTNFSLFMSSKDFLDYDNANREVSYNNNLTSNEVPSDRFLSSEHQTADYKSLLRKSNYSRQSSDTVTSMLYGNSGETSTSTSRYQTLPYTHKVPSDYSLFTSSLDTQNSSVGTIGVSRDAFSRIDDLFDQPKKENTLLTNIQTSTLPRKRSRDSLVGSRPTITRSRSDASDSSYDNRRTLLGRSLRNFQANEEEVEGRQPLFRSSIASYQNKSEESLTSITTRFGALRNRLGISSGLRSNGASENSEHSDNTYNYTRSRSIDYSYDNDRSRNEHEMTRSYDVSSGYQSYDNSYDLTRSKQQTAQPYEITSGYLSRLGNKDISAEITRLTGEISSEFLNKEGSENIDSNKTLTPDSENDIVSPILNQDENFTVLYTEEPLPCQNEIEMSETTFDVEVNFSSSCEVEVGKTLVFSNEDIDNHTIENVVKDNETSIAEVNDQNNTDMTSEQTEVTTNKVDFDKTRNQDAVGTDKDKVSSDDIDGKSTISSNSSKKKKNKKKGKKGNTADSSKVLVSHPSELLKKNKKSLSKESLNNSKSGDRKDVISPKKSKDKAETLAKKSVKDNSKTKGKEQTSPSTGKDGSDIKSDKSSESSKGKSKVKNLFDTLLHALDRKSDTSSSINLSQEDKSQSSGEKTPVTDEWEIIPAPSSGSSDSKIVLDDNYATFENEDIIAVTKRKSSDDYGGVSTDYYETASDHTISGTSEYEEFYEALPTELLGDYWNENDIHTETERKEHFVYVCASSKVKRKRILSDSKNMENINRWIDNNLYPGKKYPNQGEKVANKKFAENSAMSKNDLPPTDFKTRNKSESNNIIKSNVHPDDHKGENNLAQSKTICEDDWNNCDTIIHLQAKVETAKETDTENMENNKAKEIKQEQTIQNETSVNGLGQLRGQSDIDSGLEKLIENGHLDLNASDRAFADKLVFKLHQKLCSSCQGVLVDVLKETYFERYEELVHVNLRNDSNTVASSLDKDKSSKVDNCETKINATDTKKAQKPKRLELEDLLYGSSKASRTTETSNNVNHQDKTNDPAYIEVQQNIPSSPQKSRKDKPIIIAKNDNFLGSPNGKVSSPNDGEVRIKGKIVTLHKSKKESIVSQKPQPRLCRRKSVEAQKENAKSDNEEEYKLPNLRDNPFIRGDKLRASKGKSDSNLKASATKSPHARRSMSFQSGEKHKSPSRQKSVERSRCVRDSKSPVRQKSVEGGGLMRDSKSPSRQKSVERHGSFKGSNNTKKETVVDRTNSGLQNGKSNIIKSVDSDSYNNKSISNGKKTPPMSPKRPSIFEQLSLAKTACESIGINSDTDKISDQDSESKTLKAPPRKKKLSAPFRDTDVANDLDLSPEEAKGDTVDDDEVSPHRINLINWDPTKLLNVLYTVKLNKDTTEDVSHQFVNMEGLMEKLPMNKKKATLLKTWKRRFFRAKDGWLHYYETNNRDKPSDSVQLMGGKIEDLGNRVLGVDDGRGRFLMVRCPTEKEYGQWKMALESQTVNNIKATYVRPALSSPPHPEKKVILIDIGSGGIRAGIMGAQPCLPQMYFPSLVARNKATQELVIGIDAFKPEVRKNSTLIRIVEPSNKVEKFAIDMELILAVFNYIFKGLKVDAAKYWVMLSTPYKLGDTAMNNLMQILVDTYHTKGVCMVMQSLLALYSYNATSGIIVDIGERMEILPIFDGVLIEGGVSRQAYGGQKVRDSLNSSLVELKYKFNNPVDKLIIRYVMEQSCYVCDNYKDLKSKCDKDSESFQTTVYLNNFDLPDDAHMSVSHDLSCFKSPEGFFNTDLWGMDYPCVHKLVHSAIQSCPMDNRKHMYRAIYLSGGLTMLPGFAERLENELKKLAPPGVVVEVHASPQRYHSAFIGAGTLLSNVPINEQVFISAEEWRKDGAKAFRKWKGPS